MVDTTRHQTLERLLEALNFHGGVLPDHVIWECIASGGYRSAAAVSKAFDRFVEALDAQIGWDLLDPAVVTAIRTIATGDFADAGEAFEWLRDRGLAPASRGLFNRAVLLNPGLPGLDALRLRESVTLALQRLGLGRRPCADCYLMPRWVH